MTWVIGIGIYLAIGLILSSEYKNEELGGFLSDIVMTLFWPICLIGSLFFGEKDEQD